MVATINRAIETNVPRNTQPKPNPKAQSIVRETLLNASGSIFFTTLSGPLRILWMIIITVRNMANSNTTRGKKEAVVCEATASELWNVKLIPKRTMNMTIIILAIRKSLLFTMLPSISVIRAGGPYGPKLRQILQVRDPAATGSR
jgi:hypothetical protein